MWPSLPVQFPELGAGITKYMRVTLIVPAVGVDIYLNINSKKQKERLGRIKP